MVGARSKATAAVCIRDIGAFTDNLVGYNMARNLRAKIPASDTLIIRDVNEDSVKRFLAESREVARSSGAGAEVGRVEVAENAREVAEKSVSIICFLRDGNSMEWLFPLIHLSALSGLPLSVCGCEG